MWAIGMLAACAGSAANPRVETDHPPLLDATPVPPASPAPAEQDAGPAEADAGPAPITDAQLGALSMRLSEDTGEFPSDNLVSNETSYLHVAEALGAIPRGRAYVGVGPEQNLSYIAILRPAIAYVVDIRRENLLEHIAIRAAMEDATTRAEFVGRLTAREVPDGIEDAAPFERIAEAFSKARRRTALRDEAVERSVALHERLGIALAGGDRRKYVRIHQAFFAKGLDLAYTMEGSARPYRPLRSQLAEPMSFVANERTYAWVRQFVRENRLVPLVGDFAGERALASVAQDIRTRGLFLGAFYASNVEEYLFDGRVYPAFVQNLGRFPADERSVVVRVWFDRGRPHPAQREGHRSTTIAAPLARFLERCASAPFRTFWDVVTWTPG